jgi:hypothetical protein
MSKMIGGLLFMYILITMFCGFANGSGGINSTVLAAPLAKTDNVATVQSTAGFLAGGDTIYIGGEQMTYSSLDYTHFNGLTRTSPQADVTGLMVYNQQTSLLNAALGFNINAVTTSSGLVSIFTIPVKFFTTTLPNIISGSSILSLLPFPFSFLGWIWIAFTAGIITSIGVSLVWVLSGIVGKL